MSRFLGPVMPHPSGMAGDPTDALAAQGKLIIFTHIATGKSLGFKAFLKEFTDNYNAQWNPTRVYGRMDPINVYSGTERKITIAWDIPAASVYDAYKNMQRISELLRMMYPVYTSPVATGNRSLKASPLMRIKFMNLATDASAPQQGLVGTIESLSYKPDVDAGFFDGDDGTLAVEKETRAFDSPSLYAKLVTMQCSFTVLHTHPLGFEEDWTGPSKKMKVDPTNVPPPSEVNPGAAFPYNTHRQFGLPLTNKSLGNAGPLAVTQQAAEAKVLKGK